MCACDQYNIIYVIKYVHVWVCSCTKIYISVNNDFLSSCYLQARGVVLYIYTVIRVCVCVCAFSVHGIIWNITWII